MKLKLYREKSRPLSDLKLQLKPPPTPLSSPVSRPPMQLNSLLMSNLHAAQAVLHSVRGKICQPTSSWLFAVQNQFSQLRLHPIFRGARAGCDSKVMRTQSPSQDGMFRWLQHVQFPCAVARHGTLAAARCHFLVTSCASSVKKKQLKSASATLKSCTASLAPGECSVAFLPLWCSAGLGGARLRAQLIEGNVQYGRDPPPSCKCCSSCQCGTNEREHTANATHLRPWQRSCQQPRLQSRIK